MLCIIAPEYESADDERERSTDSDTDSSAETDEDDVTEGEPFLRAAR